MELREVNKDLKAHFKMIKQKIFVFEGNEIEKENFPKEPKRKVMLKEIKSLIEDYKSK